MRPSVSASEVHKSKGVLRYSVMERKSLKELKPVAAVLWILGPALGAACGYFGSRAVSVAQMIDVNYVFKDTEMSIEEYRQNYGSYWAVLFEGEHTQADLVSRYVLFAAVLGILSAACMVGLMVMTGRFREYADGKPQLNWFDRIWTELHLALMIAALGGAVGCYIPVAEIWPAMPGQAGYEPVMPDAYRFGVPDTFVIYLCTAGSFLCLMAALAAALAMVKKLKAGTFLRGSLIGIVLTSIARAVSYATRTVFRSDKYMRKYILIGIGMIILAMTWIGAIADLVLLLIFVPRLVKKYRAIQTGVTEVKSGNLTYRIDVERDEKGPRTGFDRLAEDINEISQATDLAVQNELKNQRLKTDLISNVSHDLKTPLTSMITYVDLLKTEGLDSERAPEYLDIIDEKTRRLKSLTEDLFEAAKASSGNIPCEIADVDILTIVEQALAEMDDRLAERNLNMIVKNDLESTMVRADGQLLWRVIENLLSNVSKYALEGSRVYINLSDAAGGASTGKGHALLEVKNMSQDALNIPADELMERFKRGDESRNTEGSGLGLAIAKDLTHLMGGVFEITIDGDLFKASVMLDKA